MSIVDTIVVNYRTGPDHRPALLLHTPSHKRWRVADGAALLLMEAMGWQTSALEEFGLLAHVMWYEIGSHSGKPVPTLSFCPWLALFYRSALFQQMTGLGDLDEHNVLFHHSHHVLYRCNYGITPWLDRALGTAKMCPAYE